MTNSRHYRWHGVLQSGEKVSGIIAAKNEAQAKDLLRKQGIITRRIVRKHLSKLTRCNRRIKPADITLFTRQLATLVNAGIPLMRSFEMIEGRLGKQRIKTLIESIIHDVESGLHLAQALRKHPAFFNALYCSMVAAGEQTGTLDEMLLKLAAHKEKIASVKKKVIKALTYPAAVMLIAMIVTAGLLVFVIPQFESLFKDFGAELPTLTRVVILLSKFFIAWWPLIFSIITATVYGFIRAHKCYPDFTQLNHRTILVVPIIGDIVQKASIARFVRTLSITYSAGLPLTDGLQLVADVTGNSVYTQAAFKIRDEISNGQSMQQAIHNTQVFPELVIQMIAIGEESGTLEQMLFKIADFYEENVDNAVDALSSVLEPVIMTILGLLVGGLVVAMYLPILKLGTVM